jgi:hypothetical protein
LSKGYDSFTFKRTTDEQFYTAAHLAYQQGAAGVSAFNFVYYREHGGPGRGPFTEPPFHIFNNIGDKDWVAKQPQSYVLSKAYLTKSMPLKLKAGQDAQISIYMSPPTGGWSRDAKLVLQSLGGVSGIKANVFFNGIKLERLTDVSSPYKVVYTPLVCDQSNAIGWQVPMGVMKSGTNGIRIELVEGDSKVFESLEIFAQ